MNEITRKSGFIPQATWLLVQGSELCGTVQGLRDRTGPGAIQNLGIKPAHRGQGLGEALLLQALHGFRSATLGRAMLEVTAKNDVAVRLYRRLGFIRRKILYKATQSMPVSTLH
ncbi:MAG: GNAT family N-acetyltransferase [Gemmataceae bacterium]